MARKSKGQSRSGSRKSKGWLGWVLGSADGFEGYFAQSRSLALSFVLIAPLLILYEVALLYYPPARARGAGRFVRDALSSVFHSRAGVVLNIVVVIVLLLAVFVLARRGGLRLNLIIPMGLESSAWAAVHVGLAVFLMQAVFRIKIDSGFTGSIVLANVVNAIGAGVYEEIVFRLVLTSLLYLGGIKLFNEKTGHAAVFAVTVGSLLFALCHMFEPSKPADWMMLLYFFCCGLFWSVLYTCRGLGVAVYSHVIFDIVAYLGQR